MDSGTKTEGTHSFFITKICNFVFNCRERDAYGLIDCWFYSLQLKGKWRKKEQKDETELYIMEIHIQNFISEVGL